MKLRKVIAAAIALAGVVLLVLSTIERDAGLLWMPILHIVGWGLLMVATALAIYKPEEAEAARLYAQAEAKKEDAAKKAA